MARRFVTALLYLSDGFDGGETNFPTSAATKPSEQTKRFVEAKPPMTPVEGWMHNVHRVRHEYKRCQVTPV